MKLDELISSIEETIETAQTREDTAKREIDAILDGARRDQRANLSQHETARTDALFADIDQAKAGRRRSEARLSRAREVEADEARIDAMSRDSRPTAADARLREAGNGTASFSVTSEPHTYARETDAKGAHFLADVVNAYRGEPTAIERLARHQREYQVDNPRMERAAGDVTTGSLPNPVVPSYLVSEYAAKPSAARPFADICRHVDLPAEGLKVEMAKGNTSATAALQTSELVAAGGGNFDADPLELSVQTAEAWQLISRQAIERGRVSEQIVLDDMLTQVGSLVDSTLITQATHGPVRFRYANYL